MRIVYKINSGPNRRADFYEYVDRSNVLSKFRRMFIATNVTTSNIFSRIDLEAGLAVFSRCISVIEPLTVTEDTILNIKIAKMI